MIQNTFIRRNTGFEVYAKKEKKALLWPAMADTTDTLFFLTCIEGIFDRVR